jgi:hypothetical protein
MKKFGLLVLATVAASCVCTGSAMAEVRNIDTVPSCIDSIEPEIACFGADVLISPQTMPNPVCQSAINSALNSCATQEMTGMNRCSRLTDPVAQGNCLAINDDTAESCYNSASSLCNPYQP